MVQKDILPHFHASGGIQMEYLAQHMGSRSIKFIGDHMNPGSYGYNSAVYQNPGRQISQMGSL